MFEIATQFNAIFRAQTNAQEISVSLLSMWTSRRVKSFLTMLQGEFRQMEDSASLRDALDACVFFAASMGRLGADFTAQLPPLFDDKMHSLVVHFWTEGASQLEETLRICREAGVAAPLSSSSAVTPPTPTDACGDSDEGPMPPPRQLMSLPPMGRLVNAVLAGLNELRRCLLPGIFAKLRVSMDELVKEVETILQQNERAVMTPGMRGDAAELRAKAKEMRQVMSDIVVPYLRGALELSLGNEAGSKEYLDPLVELLRPPPPTVEEEEEAVDDEAPAAADEPTEDDMAPEPETEQAEEEGGWNEGLEGFDEEQENDS